MLSKIKLSLFFLFLVTLSSAQMPQKWSSVEIYEQLKKVNFLGSVLYVAAHPDDENTRLISYFSNYYHAETAYLSLTRGDGGQNLIGSELREQLGAIRTQELLAARKIDGGIQYFSRANDFGFSKTPTETFDIWDKNQVLEDVIQTIETFKPDIIINRFDHRSPGTTHGHHTASAMLTLEAYETMNFKPKRVFFNTSWWFYGSMEAFEKADKTNLYAIQANVYLPLLGKSNFEIAALSRSQHRCQGFGTMGIRGAETEYLELLKGNMPNKDNIFEGIDTTWNRIKEGNEIGKILYEIEANFNFKNPEKHIPQLVEAYKLLQNSEDEHWKNKKLNQLSKLIEACAGLYLEAVSSVEKTTKNNPFAITVEAINRSDAKIVLESVHFGNKTANEQNISLQSNVKKNLKLDNNIVPTNAEYSTLFWLKETSTIGMYTVPNKSIRILPEENLTFPILFKLEIEGQKIEIIKNLVYKTNDPAMGETYIPFAVVPQVTASMDSKTVLFTSNEAQNITLKLKSNAANAKGKVRLEIPSEWKIEPKEINFEFSQINDEKIVQFKLFPPKNDSNAIMKTVLQMDSITYAKELIEIQYPHIPKQTILQNLETKIRKTTIQKSYKKIGYIQGAGDEVGKNLENIGYKITYLNIDEITPSSLTDFDAIILGIRAFNVLDALAYKNKILFEYVENGGNLIVQYNTNNGLVTKEIAPFPLTISRDRVTNENAKVTFIEPNHPVLNSPNTITSKDFEGWVQEQGLYYPDKFSSDFKAIFESSDLDESPKKGALLVAKYGKGNYIYTGLSFFRELPEGVSGAYKLFVNLIELK